MTDRHAHRTPDTADSHQTEHVPDWAVALAGTAIIGATYGLARFGLGLHGPRIVQEVPGAERVFAVATAVQFLAYCVAALAAFTFSDQRPRTGLLLAGASATTGCLLVATASGPWTLVAGAFVGGLGAGFASPAMVRVVDAAVAGRRAGLVQTTVNTGTAVGVVVAGVIGFALAQVTAAWITMAALCAVAAVAALWSARGVHGVAEDRSGPAPAPAQAPLDRSALLVPGGAAVLAGLGSALVWSHGPLLLERAGTVAAERSGWLWIALGAGGLLGPLTSALVDRLGSAGGWRALCWGLAASGILLALALRTESAALAFGAMAVFGFAYMGMSGTLILISRLAQPERAAAATSVLFVALAAGQAAGSVLIDRVATVTTPSVAAGVAALCCAAAAVLLRTPTGADRPQSRAAATSR